MRDRWEYEADLLRMQQAHLRAVANRNWRPCMHDSCPECLGTGIKRLGGFCVHAIACPCPKCSPTSGGV